MLSILSILVSMFYVGLPFFFVCVCRQVPVLLVASSLPFSSCFFSQSHEKYTS